MLSGGEERLRPAAVVVDLDAVVRNLGRVRQSVGGVEIMAVVKADAYGHGAAETASALADAGIDGLAVALVEEGIELRRLGLQIPILVLGPARPEDLVLYVEHGLTPTASSVEQVQLWLAHRDAGRLLPGLHLKMDSGMGRLGLSPHETVSVLRELGTSGLDVVGLSSHFGDADTPEGPRNAKQLAVFEEVVAALDDGLREKIKVHIANSAAALHLPGSRFDMVRCGLALYGLDPANIMRDLEPAMSVVSRVVQLRDVPVGAQPGYGGRWTASRPSRIGVVPVGYADGYNWRLGTRDDSETGGEALVVGRRVPVVGAISMDMLFLDLTGIDAEVGSRVTLLGRDGSEQVTAWDLARVAGTIPYEVLCHFGLRMPRVYPERGAHAPGRIRAPDRAR